MTLATLSAIVHNEKFAVVMLQIVLILLVSYIAHYIIKLLIVRVKKHFEGTETIWDDVVLESLTPPILVIIWLVAITLIMDVMSHIIEMNLMQFIPNIRKIGVILMLTWILLRMISSMEKHITAESYKLAVAKGTADLLTKVSKGVILAISTLLVLESLGFSISGLIAVGGIGGIAISLAAQNMLSNIFGTLTLYMDKPFMIGEIIHVPESNLKGMVEEIGWRVTKIKNNDKFSIYVPNSTFNKSAIINISRTKNRHLLDKLGLKVNSTTQYNKIAAEVMAYLKAHKNVNQRLYIGVMLGDFGMDHMEMVIDCYLTVADGNVFQNWRSNILLAIYDIIIQNEAVVLYSNENKQLLR